MMRARMQATRMQRTSSSSAGSVSSSTAMEVRLRSPPETPRWKAPPMGVAAHFSRPSVRSRRSTRARFASRDKLAGSRSSAA
jgi:hypothetical protein